MRELFVGDRPRDRVGDRLREGSECILPTRDIPWNMDQTVWSNGQNSQCIFADRYVNYQ